MQGVQGAFVTDRWGDTWHDSRPRAHRRRDLFMLHPRWQPKRRRLDDRLRGLMKIRGKRRCGRNKSWLKCLRRAKRRDAALLALLEALRLALVLDDETPVNDREHAVLTPLVTQLVDDLVTAPHAPTGRRVVLVAA